MIISMPLHIALEGIDGVGKTTLSEKLLDFFTRKQYKTSLQQQPSLTELIYILNKYNLTNYETALLTALDRSIQYRQTNWNKYDIVIWDRSILSSYAYNTSKKVKKSYIKQINKYYPEMDLYIIITHDKILEKPDYSANKDIIKKYQELAKNYPNTKTTPYLPNQPNKMLENIINIIFEELPKCEWCPRIFKPTQQHKKYCSRKCAEASKEEQYRRNSLKYYHKYKNTMTERQKGGLGSKNANLHGTADPNPFIEMEKVRRAKKSLGLKPIQ